MLPSRWMEPVDRSSKEMLGLVDELDTKLASTRTRPSDPIVIQDDEAWLQRVPTWFGMAMVTVLGVALGFVVVQPWQERCPYGREFCQIAELDIDAIRVTVPDSALIAALADIDELDPEDRLTAGDIFAMDRFDGVDFESLLTDEEIESVLEATRGR